MAVGIWIWVSLILARHFSYYSYGKCDLTSMEVYDKWGCPSDPLLSRAPTAPPVSPAHAPVQPVGSTIPDPELGIRQRSWEQLAVLDALGSVPLMGGMPWWDLRASIICEPWVGKWTARARLMEVREGRAGVCSRKIRDEKTFPPMRADVLRWKMPRKWEGERSLLWHNGGKCYIKESGESLEEAWERAKVRCIHNKPIVCCWTCFMWSMDAWFVSVVPNQEMGGHQGHNRNSSCRAAKALWSRLWRFHCFQSRQVNTDGQFTAWQI